jgi:protein-S-isoprenylcysteine O-methyltransferase Ste14
MRHLWYPALVAAVVWAFARLDSLFGWKGVRLPWAGWALLAAGAALAAWCSWLLVRRGRGTPHPFAAKTRRLVKEGPYGVVRNPMMWAVGAILAGLALVRGSLGLLLCLAGFLVYIPLFIAHYEERDMERRFGEEYREYCRRVPRWWPGGQRSR